MKSDKSLAKKWLCNERTVRRWRTLGAPLNSEKQMRVWLAGQRSIPAGTMAILEKHNVAVASKEAKAEQTLPIGAAHALERLAEMEARAYTSFKKASERGDPAEIRFTRETWLKTSEQLRRHDLAVEMNRRVSGELCPRTDLERLAFEIQQALYYSRFAIRSAVITISGLEKPEDVLQVLESIGDAMHACLKAWTQRPRGEGHEIPPWLIKAVNLGSNPVEEYTEGYAKLWLVMEAVMQQAGEKAKEKLETRHRLEREWREAKDPAERARIWESLNASYLGRL